MYYDILKNAESLTERRMPSKNRITQNKEVLTIFVTMPGCDSEKNTMRIQILPALVI